jgi:hypothetical protein
MEVNEDVLNVVSGLAAKHSRRHHDSCRAEALDHWEISRFAAGTYMLNGPSLHHDPVVIQCLAASVWPPGNCLISADTKCDARCSATVPSAESVTTATLFTCFW